MKAMNLRADLDDVSSLGAAIASASESRAGIIVSIAVRIGTGLLEDGRVVDLPVPGSTGLGSVVGTSTAVVVGVEGHAGGLAGDSPASAVLDGQLIGAVGVDVGLATGGVAVVVGARFSVVGAIDGEDRQGKVVAIDQGDVIIIQTTMTVKGELSQGHWRNSTGTGALNFVTCYEIIQVKKKSRKII